MTDVKPLPDFGASATSLYVLSSNHLLGCDPFPEMAKASIKLTNGTFVQVDGGADEIAKLLALYGGGLPVRTPSPPTSRRKKSRAAKSRDAAQKSSDAGTEPDLAEIINLVKTCDEAEAIEEKILDKVSQVNRILLPLYIVHEYLNNAYGLTSGEISQITTDLGIPIAGPNASTTLSGTASRYVVGDTVRKRGHPVRYKLTRRGLQYLKTVLTGKGNGK